jgi:lipopolysaccharide/colanic/teichoic acid biosynthesis glycosyltransferase
MTKPINSYPLGSLKRGMDVLVSLILLPILLPLIGIGAVLLVIPTRGKVLFTQRRLGLNGKEFTIYKLRTLKPEAIHDTAGMSRHSNDFVAFGRWIRRWRIDELPQVVNIFLGEMSWIGPRPERPHIASRCLATEARFAERLAVRPGITGWAQVHLPNATPVENLEKLPFDMEYVSRANLAMDLRIIFRTLTAIL